MESILNFAKRHKESIACAACGLIIYRLGFKAGYKESMKTISNYISTCRKALEVVHF